MFGTKNLFIILQELLIWFIDCGLFSHPHFWDGRSLYRDGIKNCKEGRIIKGEQQARPLVFGI